MNQQKEPLLPWQPMADDHFGTARFGVRFDNGPNGYQEEDGSVACRRRGSAGQHSSRSDGSVIDRAARRGDVIKKIKHLQEQFDELTETVRRRLI
jgi:hypothetical protein